MRRRVLQVIVAVMVCALPLVTAVVPARADNAGALLGLVNTLRAANGLGPLYADPALTKVAQAWSAHMASGYGLGHNPNLGAQVGGSWTKLGENVGEGGDITGIFNAFVNSSFHRGNMLDPTYNLTGIAVAIGRLNTLWVTEDFEGKPGATPATTRPPATTTPTTRARTPTPTVPGTTAPTVTTVPAATVTTVTTTASTTTAPPSDSTTVAGEAADGGLLPGDDSAPPAPPPSKLAVAASAHGGTGGSLLVWLLVLSVFATVSVAVAAFFINRRLQSPRQ